MNNSMIPKRRSFPKRIIEATIFFKKYEGGREREREEREHEDKERERGRERIDCLIDNEKVCEGETMRK